MALRGEIRDTSLEANHMIVGETCWMWREAPLGGQEIGSIGANLDMTKSKIDNDCI